MEQNFDLQVFFTLTKKPKKNSEKPLLGYRRCAYIKCHYKISGLLSNRNEISAYSVSFKLLESVIVNAYPNTWSEIHFKHFLSE